MKLYYSPGACSLSPHIALLEAGLPYELVQHTRGADFRAPPSLYDVHPLGKAPAVEVDGRVMVESSAIIEYIVDRHGGGKLLPPDSARAEYLEWLHFAEGSAMLPFMLALYVGRLGEAGAQPHRIRYRQMTR